MAEKLFKSSEVIKEAKITRQRLHQLRKGYKRKSGEKVLPVLIMNVHYTYIEGNLRFTEQGIKKIRLQKREKTKNETRQKQAAGCSESELVSDF